MKLSHKYLLQYVEAKLQERNLSDQLEGVMRRFNSENQVFSMTPPKVYDLVETLMLELVADRELLDWVHWWMYDCEHGTRHMDFTVEGREYDVTDLTFQEFLEIVDASN